MMDLEFDLVVIGAGGAGCTAAITAAREGASVALLSKEALAIGNTRMAGGAVASSGVSEGDAPEILKEDMILGGEYLNNPELVGLLAKGATSAIQFLESLGVFFQRDEEGRLSAKAADKPGGHRFHRVFYSAGSGMVFGYVLRNAIAHEKSISVFEDTFVVSLFREEGEVRGALALDLKMSRWLILRSKATILAAGGCGWLYYPQTTNNRSATGDGYAIAFEAGAQMVDMEMVQFFPFAMNHPTGLAGSMLADTSLAGPKGKLINGSGEVVADHDINLLTRAQATALMAKEISAGRITRWGGLKLDLSGNLDVPEMVKYKELSDEKKQFEKVRKGYGEAAFQWKEPWDVSPSAHYMMGGIMINHQGCSIPNLYAVGEVAGGLMGANRLPATSLADIFAMGIHVGKEASRFSSESSIKGVKESLIHQEMDKVERLFGKRGSKRPIQIERELQGLMRDHVGIVRDEKRLSHALMEINRLEEELERNTSISMMRRYNTELLDALELKNMLTCARMIATSARIRKESRGAHLRLDYSDRDDINWLKNITLRKGKNQIEASVSDAMAPKIYGYEGKGPGS